MPKKPVQKMALYWIIHNTQTKEPLEAQSGPYFTWSDAYDDNKNWVVQERVRIVRQIVEVTEDT